MNTVSHTRGYLDASSPRAHCPPDSGRAALKLQSFSYVRGYLDATNARAYCPVGTAVGTHFDTASRLYQLADTICRYYAAGWMQAEDEGVTP